MARKRRGRDPEVLRRAYGDRARPLEETILSLLPPLPPSPEECRCQGQRCLGCVGSSHLLRPDDPADYRGLLTCAFCVVSCGAPPPPVIYHRCSGMPQRRIVRHVMELTIGNSQVPNNVLCNGYDKQSRFSYSGEYLCTSAWDLLLTRIGDAMMVFLLEFSSIFIPFPKKNYNQVTGTPLYTLLQNPKFSCITSASRNEQSCWEDRFNCGNKMKRRRCESEDRPKKDTDSLNMQRSSLLGFDDCLDFNSCTVLVGNPSKHVRECQTMDKETGLIHFLVQDCSTKTVGNKVLSLKEHQARSNTNSCLHPEEPRRLHSSDVTNNALMLEGKEYFCTLRNCESEYGREVMVGSSLFSHSQEMHLAQVVSPSQRSGYDALVSSGTDNFRRSAAFGFNNKSKKHVRLFSWQRRKKRKLHSEEHGLSKVLIDDKKDSSWLKLQQNSDRKFFHQHLESLRPNYCGAITDAHLLKDSNLVSIHESSVLEVVEAVSNINAHSANTEGMYNCGARTDEHLLKDPNLVRIHESSVLEAVEAVSNINAHSANAEGMHNDELVVPFLEKSHDWTKSRLDKLSDEKPHANMGSLGISSMNMQETLESLISHNCRTHVNLLTKSTPIEIPSSSSLEQNEHHTEKMSSLCFYCLMLQATPKVALGDHIKRQYIFYNRFSLSSVFPRNYILSRLKPNDSGAISLMKHIFGIPGEQVNIYFSSCTRCNGYSAIKSECLYHSLLGSLKSLIRNAQRCQNRKLLRKHCLVSPSKQLSKDFNEPTSKLVVKGRLLSLKMSKKRDTDFQHSSTNMLAEGSYINKSGNEIREQLHDKTSTVCDPQFDPIRSFCRHHHVVSFIWAVIRRIVPLNLLGYSSTWRALRKNISKFVRLRRFETFCLKQCVHGLKTSCYPFLSKIRFSHCYCNNNSTDDSGNGKNIRQELRNSSEDKMTLHNKIFQRWIYWLFSYIVVPVISANFYVTERESGKQDVFYYPKPVWGKLVGRTITCLNRQNYRLIDKASFWHILRRRSFGFSKVRFLPKENYLRPLANLKAPSKVQLSHHEFASRYCFATREKIASMHQKPINTNRKRRLVPYRSVNSCLRELHVILRKIKVEHPQKLGSSVFDYNDIYKKLLQFLSELRSESRTIPQVFVVVADVSKAFDSIDQDMLIAIMKNIVQTDEYLLRRYAQIVCTKKYIKALYEQVSYDRGGANSDISIQLSSAGNIFIDQGITKRIKLDMLHNLLSEHLKHNVLQLGHNFYLQKIGIPQGSLLSSLLCSFYYGHLERSVILPYLEKTLKQTSTDFKKTEHVNRCMCTADNSGTEPGDNAIHGVEFVEDGASHIGQSKVSNFGDGQLILSDIECSCQSDHAAVRCTDGVKSQSSSSPNNLLMRLIDDFLFISTSKKQAASFFNRMRRGFRDYNCFMNNEKFGLNFDMEQSSSVVNRVYTGADGISFLPWSGMLLNCHTLEIQADYTRYWGIHISSTITVHAHDKPAYHLKGKLCDYMRPKCHPIFYDSRINSPTIVKLNAYQAFLLCAMKFHCYVCSLPDIAKQNPSYQLEIIERSFSYMYKLIKKQMHDMEHNFTIHPILHLKKVEVIWLGLSAYIRILKKKPSRHMDLLSLLRCKFVTHERICDASSHLKYAVDDSHSSMFWKIKF